MTQPFAAIAVSGCPSRTRTATFPPSLRWLTRSAVALTWIYNGLWLKLIDAGGRHSVIVAQATGWSPSAARAAVVGLGLLECLIAVAVLSGWRPRLAAWVQISLLTGMNAAGLCGAGGLIPDVADMLVTNFAFVALILCTAHLENHDE